MAYNINKSDENKSPITVPDMPPGINTVDTSLSLVGRNYPNYGQAIAENFLHLLENFASQLQPTNPIEGQLWYDISDSSDKKLKVFDGATWYPTNGVHKSAIAPTNIKLGDIWVDTEAQLLKIYNGTDWTLVGPSYSSSLRTGSYPAQIEDRTGDLHDVILMYLNDIVVEIIAKESFTPLAVIDGFSNLVPGVNLSTKTLDSSTPKFNGIATIAQSLQQTSPAVENVSANNFIRNDVDQSTTGLLVINNDTGLKIGRTTSTFHLYKNSFEAIFLNAYDSGRFVFRIDNGGVRSTILTIDGGTKRVGVNNINPTVDFDVTGAGQFSGKLTVNSNDSVNALEVRGRIKAGGITSTGTVVVNSSTFLNGDVTLGGHIFPLTTGTYDIGSVSRPIRKLYAVAVGSTGTAFTGNLVGSATRLAAQTSFVITGSVATLTPVPFDGNTGGFTKTFDARVTNEMIAGRSSTGTSVGSDLLMIYVPTEAGSDKLRSISKTDFLKEVSVGVTPTGTITPYGGTVAPTGWAFCDGTSYNRFGPGYTDLFNVIGLTFGYTASNNYKVPNLNNILFANTTTNAATWPLPIKYIIKL
jgi:hypothetical protein